MKAHPLGVSPRGTTSTGESRRPPRRAAAPLRSRSAAIAAVAAPKLRPKRDSFAGAAARAGSAGVACDCFKMIKFLLSLCYLAAVYAAPSGHKRATCS